MSEELTRSQYNAFTKAKGLPRIGGVLGVELHAVILNPDHVEVIKARRADELPGAPFVADIPENNDLGMSPE